MAAKDQFSDQDKRKGGMYSVKFLATTAILLFSELCVAQNSNFPCLSNICLADVASDHVNDTKWNSVSNDLIREGKKPSLYPPFAYGKKWVNDYVKGLNEEDKKFLVPYVEAHKFDRKLLEFLKERNPVFCRAYPFQGSFNSENGFPTDITITPDAESKLRVTGISRFYPTNDRLETENRMRAIATRYPYLRYGHGITTPWGSGTTLFTNERLEFYLYVNEEGPSDRKMAQQPACGVTQSSLD